MRPKFFSFSMFLSFSASICFANISADSSLARVLLKYEEGAKAFNDLSSSGKFRDVKVLFLEPIEIEKRAGHNGGGVRQNPDTKKYEILINQDLADAQKAHAIAHELQHVRDEIAIDKYFESNPDLNAIGAAVIRGLKGTNRIEFIKSNKEKVLFVIGGLFCQERRAYEKNIRLARQGLPFDSSSALTKTGQFIYKQYVAKFGVEMTNEEIADLERKCLQAVDYVEFMKAIAPKIQPKSNDPAPAVK